MRLYILEEYNLQDKLTNYWLFDALEKCLSFDEFCKKHPRFELGYTYQIKISDPNDRD